MRHVIYLAGGWGVPLPPLPPDLQASAVVLCAETDLEVARLRAATTGRGGKAPVKGKETCAVGEGRGGCGGEVTVAGGGRAEGGGELATAGGGRGDEGWGEGVREAIEKSGRLLGAEIGGGEEETPAFDWSRVDWNAPNPFAACAATPSSSHLDAACERRALAALCDLAERRMAELRAPSAAERKLLALIEGGVTDATTPELCALVYKEGQRRLFAEVLHVMRAMLTAANAVLPLSEYDSQVDALSHGYHRAKRQTR